MKAINNCEWIVIIAYSYEGKLQNSKEQTTDLCNNMNESPRHDVRWKKAGPRYTQYDSIYIKCKNRKTQFTVTVVRIQVSFGRG